ncbi:MAG TPA: TonB-dependent receptor [Rubrivivax sp.]|nr:TonB-dependent receptor [Rubrivivax sp.]
MFHKTRISKAAVLAVGGAVVLGSGSDQALAQRVEITGTSIKRVEAEGALPVQTLTRTDIERTGAQSTEQLLQSISAMSSSGQRQTSTTGGSTYGGSGVSLRGLGEERTLVLLNGRRLAAFAGGGGAMVNVNNIPLAAIERVEVLKDGASAIYGSDAVAGVVNFILRKDMQGYEASATYGSPTQSGGGQEYQASLVAGWGDSANQSWNLTVGGQWSRSNDLFGSERSYAKSSDNFPISLPLNTGQGNIQGAWTLGTGPTNVPGAPYQAGFDNYGNPLAAAGQCGTLKGASTGSPLFNAYPWCTYDQAPDVGLLGKTETASGTANFVFRLNNQAELFADALYSRSVVTTTYQPSPMRTSFMETGAAAFAAAGVDQVLLLRPGNPAYAQAAAYLQSVGLGALVGQDLGITSRVWDFGPRSEENTVTQSRLVGGLRGDWLEQSYTVALGYSESRLDGKVIDGYFSMSSYAAATQAAGSDWNPWSPTQSTAFNNAIAGGRYVGTTLDAKTTSATFDGTLSGDVMPLPAGMMQYAAGYQYRRDTLKRDPAALLASGDIAGLGGAEKPVDESRNILAFFGELNVPIVKTLDGGVALRWDDYSDFGSTTNWKANLRWQPAQQWLVRGSYGTGFRAPTLMDLYDPQVLQSSSQFTDPVTGQQNLQVNEYTGGNPNLEPETSKQWSAGLVFQPVAQLAIGVDYFNIEVDNVISKPSTQEIVTQNALGNPLYAGLVVRDPLTGQIQSTQATLANTGTMTAQGVDIDIRYRDRLGPGVLAVGLNSTYYFKFDQSTPGATSQKVATLVNPDGSPVISSTSDLDGYGVVLRYKQYLSGTWTQGDWSTTLANRYATGYYAGWDLNGTPTRQPSQTLWDLQVAYAGFKNAVITLGGRNILDKQPSPFVYVSNQFQSGYDPGQYDPRGRFVYLTGTLRF